MFKDKINKLKFRLSAFKVRRSHMKLMRYHLKTLSLCIKHMAKINFPVTKGEVVAMEVLLSVYDETIEAINKDASIYKNNLNKILEDGVFNNE